MRPRLIVLAAVLATIALPARAPAASDGYQYSNNFDGAVGSEWSQTRTMKTPDGSRTFLGEFTNTGSTLLRLTDVPPLSRVTVSFDLLVLRSWDGNNGAPNAGPDLWDLSVTGGPTLLHATFSNSTKPQSFPDAYPVDENPARTGAALVNTLGYPTGVGGDSVYRLSYQFEAATPVVVLNFAASGTGPANLADEAWGLDNVVVTATPSCGTLCVRTVPLTKVADVTSALPGPADAITTASLELGSVRVDAAGMFVEQAVAVVRSPHLPPPETLTQQSAAASTRYRSSMRVCAQNQCSVSIGAPSSATGQKLGELWSGRLQAYASGMLITDLPVLFVQKT